MIQSTCETLSCFCEEVGALGRRMSKFGKAIAVHDLAIERANSLATLLSRFQTFCAPDYQTSPLPSDINEVCIIPRILNNEAFYFYKTFKIFRKLKSFHFHLENIGSFRFKQMEIKKNRKFE